MSRASRARRIATAAAYGSGGLGLLSAAVAGVLFGEIKLARRWVGAPEFAEAPNGDGVWGRHHPNRARGRGGDPTSDPDRSDTPTSDPDRSETGHEPDRQTAGIPHPGETPSADTAGGPSADGAAEPAARDGVWGAQTGAPEVVFAVLGDSSAAGLGVAHASETPGALVASGLAELAECPVRLINVAVVGAQTSDLGPQVEAVLTHRPVAALIMIGTNDVTHRTRPADSVRHLGEVVGQLVEAGVQVVVGTCPDLGTVKPIAPPLRWLARAWSRNLAAAQTIATVEAGGRTVSLGDLLGPEFAARPSELFSADRFHPSAEGYAAAAAAILPTIAAALGVWPDDADQQVVGLFGGEARPVANAAARAASHPGTEVTGTRVEGRERGRRGRWARSRRRGSAASSTVDPGGDTNARPPFDSDPLAGTSGPDQL